MGAGMNKREAFKDKLIRERKIMLNGCEGRHFKEHTCSGAFHLHEAIYSRNDIRHVRGKDRDYFMLDECNCAILCSVFHDEYGRSRKFKEHWLTYAEKYGDIIDYINGAKKYLKVLV